MNLLFFDLEYATSRGGKPKICEFGYVVTDEGFNIVKRGNFIINPSIEKSEWDWRVVRKILTRKVYEYEKQPDFYSFYNEINNLITSADIVLGHSLNGDAKALNYECKRYELDSLNFTFYDVKKFYKEYNNTTKDTSVTDILKSFNLVGEAKEHDAESDAFNTMLELKAMLESLNLSITELIELCPSAKDKNENYVVESIETSRLKKKAKLESILKDNTFVKHSPKGRLLLQFLDNVQPIDVCQQTLAGLGFSISINYEENHYRQLLNIIQILSNLGAKYVLKASTADVFVTYDAFNEDGTLKPCSKARYVKEAIDAGKSIEVISFNEFLGVIGLSESQLDDLPMVSFDCLYRENAIIKDRKITNLLNNKEDNKNSIKPFSTTIGDLFGDILVGC